MQKVWTKERLGVKMGAVITGGGDSGGKNYDR